MFSEFIIQARFNFSIIILRDQILQRHHPGIPINSFVFLTSKCLNDGHNSDWIIYSHICREILESDLVKFTIQNVIAMSRREASIRRSKNHTVPVDLHCLHHLNIEICVWESERERDTLTLLCTHQRKSMKRHKISVSIIRSRHCRCDIANLSLANYHSMNMSFAYLI